MGVWFGTVQYFFLILHLDMHMPNSNKSRSSILLPLLYNECEKNNDYVVVDGEGINYYPF